MYISVYALAGVVISLESDNGIINAPEGESVNISFSASGFSYGAIPVQVSFFSYSQFASDGYDLTNFFDSADIPSASADGTLIAFIKSDSVWKWKLSRPFQVMPLLFHSLA